MMSVDLWSSVDILLSVILVWYSNSSCLIITLSATSTGSHTSDPRGGCCFGLSSWFCIQPTWVLTYARFQQARLHCYLTWETKRRWVSRANFLNGTASACQSPTSPDQWSFSSRVQTIASAGQLGASKAGQLTSLLQPHSTILLAFLTWLLSHHASPRL